MEFTHEIQACHRNGNLHVDMLGHFTPEAAGKLTSTIAEEYRGKGNIFINTSKIMSFTEDSKDAFANYLSLYGIPYKNLYLTGEKSIEIGPEKIKVIPFTKKKSGCCGRCRDCKCHDKN